MTNPLAELEKEGTSIFSAFNDAIDGIDSKDRLKEEQMAAQKERYSNAQPGMIIAHYEPYEA